MATTMQLSMFTLADAPYEAAAHPGQATGHYMGTCRRCTRTFRQTDATPRLHACTASEPRHIPMRPIVGTYNGRVKCGAKCQSATGPDCECSCGGARHGSHSS